MEAHETVSAESEGRSTQGGRTTVAVVASRSGPTQPTTRSTEVQTDLTWSKGQEEPSIFPPYASPTYQHLTQTTSKKLSSNNTGGTQTSGKRQSSRIPPNPLFSNQNSFNIPHGKPPDKRKKVKRPKL